MPNKCCIYGCKSNYKTSNESVSCTVELLFKGTYVCKRVQVCLSSFRADKPFYGLVQNKFFYLLNDTVHILKCIRNNWFTEETKQLEYKLPNDGGSMYVAKWSHLEEQIGLYVTSD